MVVNCYSGKFYAFGYKLISQAGTGIGFSGKARYSADVAVCYHYLCVNWTFAFNYAFICLGYRLSMELDFSERKFSATTLS